MSKDDLIKFMEWLKSRGIFLATHHHHSDLCQTDSLGRRTKCGYARGELQPSKQDIATLAAKYMEKP